MSHGNEPPKPLVNGASSASAGAFGPESELFHFADLLPVTVIAADPAGKELYLNGRAREYLGVEREALDGNLWLERIHPSDRQGAASAWQDAAEKGQAHHLEFRLLRSTSGDYRWNRLESVPLRGPDGAVALVFGTLTDIHDRKRSEEEAERRSERQRKFAHRQAALAELGLFALEGHDLPTLMERATRIVADMLDVEFCKLLRRDEGATLLLEAGVGWRPGLVGSARVPGGRGSQAGFALDAQGPVIELDLRTETRFTSSPLLVEHGVVSGMSVVVQTPDGPYGVLGAHTREMREFTEDEVDSLQAVANILGEAVYRRRNEEALAASEDRFRRVFENAAVGIALLRPDLRILDANERLGALLGRVREDLLERRLSEFGHPDDEQRTSDAIGSLLSGELASAQFEKRYLRADGSVLWADVAASLSRGFKGESHYMVVAIQDVTARVQALELEAHARREAEAANDRLSLLADASHILAGSLDSEEALARLAGLAVPRMADWCAVHVVGESGRLERLAVTHQDPAKLRCEAELEERYGPDPKAPFGPYAVARTGEPEYYPQVSQEALERTVTDERQRELLRLMGISSVVIVPLKSRGRSLGTLSLMHAESGRRFSESDLRLAVQLGERAGVAVDNAQLFQDTQELNEALEARVEQRTQELMTALEELEAFTYSASHDLRTPLRAINGFSQALAEDYAGSLDDTARRYLDRIAKGAQHMGRLIDDLLHLSRVSRTELKTSEVDLSDLARKVVASLRGAEPDRVVTVEIEDGVQARGDVGLLRLAMENLLGNAWKFTRDSPEARISFGSERRDGTTVYVVRDNGAGFDMSYADKLFAPFQRLHTPGAFEGSGIGLATVERVIRKHGGRVWAESRPGDGASFYFSLGEADAD